MAHGGKDGRLTRRHKFDKPNTRTVPQSLCLVQLSPLTCASASLGDNANAPSRAATTGVRPRAYMFGRWKWPATPGKRIRRGKVN